MAVYRARHSRFYHYDFELNGRRFHGTTKATNRRAAEEVERTRKSQARREIEATCGAEAELKGDAPLTLDIAAGRWWDEIGRRRADAGCCERDVERMIAHFGADRRLDGITDSDVAAWIAARRGERVWGKTKFKDGRDAPLISPARVNRATVDILRAIYGRARRVWKVPIAAEPDWRQHRLKEPEERVRELEAAEQTSIDSAAREGYDRLYRFARLSGLRLSACLLRKDDVKWSLGRIEVRSKGGKLNRVPLSAEIRALLLECWQDHPEFVFTYVAKRTDGEQHHRGKRYPITASGLRSQWKRDRKRAAKEVPSIMTFRFHDNRHTAGTRLLRHTGNLKMVQKLLNHARISTTAKYAHVLDDELLDAMDGMEDRDTKSRRKSRSDSNSAA
jgi:hypothetical protein